MVMVLVSGETAKHMMPGEPKSAQDLSGNQLDLWKHFDNII